MTFVVSLEGFMPPARFDAVAWTTVQIAEAAGPAGPWSQIDQQALVPLDPNPALPAARNFTTTHAVLSTGWYRVVFLDPGGGQSQPSDAVRSSSGDSSLPPTPDDVRNASPLLRSMFPLPIADPYRIADLRNWVYQSVAAVQAITWRIIDPTLGCAAPDDDECELVPDALVPTAAETIIRMVERKAVISQPDLAEQFATGRQLSSFTAGPYSEAYFAPGEFARRGVVSRPAMDPDPTINENLWALATEDAKDYFVWRSANLAPPSAAVVSFDYRRQSLGYSAGSLGGLGGGFGRGGPDGY